MTSTPFILGLPGEPVDIDVLISASGAEETGFVLFRTGPRFTGAHEVKALALRWTAEARDGRVTIYESVNGGTPGYLNSFPWTVRGFADVRPNEVSLPVLIALHADLFLKVATHERQLERLCLLATVANGRGERMMQIQQRLDQDLIYHRRTFGTATLADWIVATLVNIVGLHPGPQPVDRESLEEMLRMGLEMPSIDGVVLWNTLSTMVNDGLLLTTDSGESFLPTHKGLITLAVPRTVPDAHASAAAPSTSNAADPPAETAS